MPYDDTQRCGAEDDRARQIREEARAQTERLRRDIAETDAYYERMTGMKPSELRQFHTVEYVNDPNFRRNA